MLGRAMPGPYSGPAAVRRRTSTVPAAPSTRRWSPSRRRRVPSTVFITQGMPSSRATTAAWDSWPPMSTTRALAMNMSDAQLGSVVGALGEARLADARRGRVLRGQLERGAGRGPAGRGGGGQQLRLGVTRGGGRGGPDRGGAGGVVHRPVAVADLDRWRRVLPPRHP